MASQSAGAPVIAILFAVSFSHLLNDAIQAVLPAIYPMLKTHFELSFEQIGNITLTFQLFASVLQPLVGMYSDHRPQPYSLPIGMSITLVGIIVLACASSYQWVLAAAALVGMGSAVFHPEASRIARLASGGAHGFAQSVFQVGGNAGSSFGPLLAAAIVVPYGLAYVGWFTLAAVTGIGVLIWVGRWYSAALAEAAARSSAKASLLQQDQVARPPTRTVIQGVSVLIVLIFSKYFYLSCMVSYFTFYLIHRFEASIPTSQIFLFLFLFSVALGTIIGGPVGDRYGRKVVIWISILGTAPFTLLLPHAPLWGVGVLVVPIGFILASAFSAIVVYAQELMPGKVGLVAGLFFGFAFGMAGIASAVLGKLADRTSIEFVFSLCAWLPLLGLFAYFLPDVEHKKKAKAA